PVCANVGERSHFTLQEGRIQLEARIVLQASIVSKQLRRTKIVFTQGGIECPAALSDKLNEIAVCLIKGTLLHRVAAATRGGGVLGIIDSRKRRRIDLVRRDSNTDPVRKFNDALLQGVRQAHIALQHVVLEQLCALQLHLEVSRARNRDPHSVVDAPVFKYIAGRKYTGTCSQIGFSRFALLNRLVGDAAKTLDGCDAERKAGTAVSFSVL